MSRMGVLWGYVATNGCGKSTLLKKLLPYNQRNLIIPSNRDDSAWHGIAELKPEVRFELDPRDPKGLRKKPVDVIPGLPSFSGNRVVHVDGPEAFEAVTHPGYGFKNGGLVLDDIKNYVESQALIPGHVRTLLGGRRHRMLDIFFAAWAFQDINADLYGFQTELFIGYVTRPPDRDLARKVRNYDELVDTWKRSYEINSRLPANRRWHYEYFKPA